MKHFNVAVAIVFGDGKVMITRRKRGQVLAGNWEFPGGKQEAGESLQDCVRRELLEEVAITVQPQVALSPIQHQYPDRHVTLHAFLCTHESGRPTAIACDQIRWVTPAQLQTFTFPAANQTLIEQVIAAFPAALNDFDLQPRPTPPPLGISADDRITRRPQLEAAGRKFSHR